MVSLIIFCFDNSFIPAKKIEITTDSEGKKVGTLIKGKQRKEVPLNEHGVPLDKIGVPMVLLEGCTEFWVSTTPKEQRSYSHLILHISIIHSIFRFEDEHFPLMHPSF